MTHHRSCVVPGSTPAKDAWPERTPTEMAWSRMEPATRRNVGAAHQTKRLGAGAAHPDEEAWSRNGTPRRRGLEPDGIPTHEARRQSSAPKEWRGAERHTHRRGVALDAHSQRGVAPERRTHPGVGGRRADLPTQAAGPDGTARRHGTAPDDAHHRSCVVLGRHTPPGSPDQKAHPPEPAWPERTPTGVVWGWGRSTAARPRPDSHLDGVALGPVRITGGLPRPRAADSIRPRSGDRPTAKRPQSTRGGQWILAAGVRYYVRFRWFYFLLRRW